MQLLLFWACGMRTIIYVDGFNLYYRALKYNPQFKWLNVKALAEDVLSSENVITAVKYYTARVSARIDPDAPRRQQIYFDALETIPELEIFQGKFLVTKPYAALAPPPQNGKSPFKPWPTVVRIIKTEEKGSDVNLGAHLVRDAFTNAFDVAVVLSNDTDLCEPIRIVVEELQKPVGIICPAENVANDLQDVASFVRHISHSRLARSQFPNPVVDTNGQELHKPTAWVEQDGD
jgi:uncharacterized LabA/DUF88 family protein